MITKNDTFTEIISQNKSLSSVLERFGIVERDYKKTIAEAGKELNTDPEFMVEIIKAFDEDNKPDQKVLMKFPIETILDYLRKSHRYYLDKKIPEIEISLQDIIRRSNQGSSMLFALGNLFIVYKRKLTEHIISEEKELFPYIDYLVNQFKGDFDFKIVKKTLASFTIQKFEATHSNVEEDIEKTRETILKYSPEKTFAMSYRIFLNQLELFERDLHRHSIIEDEVLVPKAQRLEELLKGIVVMHESYRH